MKGKEVMSEGVTSNDTTSRIADKIIDILNTHDIKSFIQLCAEDVVFDNPDLEGSTGLSESNPSYPTYGRAFRTYIIRKGIEL